MAFELQDSQCRKFRVLSCNFRVGGPTANSKSLDKDCFVDALDVLILHSTFFLVEQLIGKARMCGLFVVKECFLWTDVTKFEHMFCGHRNIYSDAS